MKVLHPILQQMLDEYRNKHASYAITHQQIINEINWHISTQLTNKLYAEGLISYAEYVALNELNWQTFKAFFKDLHCCSQHKFDVRNKH